MKGFFSPVDKLAAELPRTKGTGAEFMTELSKRPGYKPQEAQDRDLQALMALPKMAREEFLAKLKAKPAPKLKVTELDNSDDDYPPAKYEQYTLPGGTNYREILMRMPHDEQRAKEFSDPASGHWDVPDVLAHVRAKDRLIPDTEGPHAVKVIGGGGTSTVKFKTPEEAQRFAEVKHQGGFRTEITPLNHKKLLHIEEIQSDWHQKGREHGYATPESLKEFRAVELRHKLLKQKLDEAKAQSESAENSLKRKEPLFQQPDVRERYEAARVKANNDLMDLMPQVMKAQAEMQDFGHKMNSMVPNAPFKKNWHEMALKKMIHHAAENGYHGIVITPGLEQAKRYNLAKHISGLQYDPEQKHLIAAGHNGEAINKIVEPHELPDYLGKEVTEKLLNTLPLQGRHHLTGINLQTGGEGMTGFYDKMVPSFLNQFGKKYGAQVGTMPLPIEGGIEPGWVTKPAAPRAIPVHHFPITPEMREDVTKNGVPLYAKGGAVEDDGDVPKKTVKAYKMFRADKKQPGKLFPLFVDSNTPVDMDKWITAKEGEKSTTNTKKVKSKIGDLAYRPGWHAGDLPIATHIGDKDEEQKAEARRIRELRDAHAAVLGNTKAAKAIARKEHPYPSWVNAPRLRNPNHIWAEVEMPDDVDWQSEATKRGYNDQGKLIASQAHITDQLPLGGHYRYKTNSNMLGNWLIGGSMKVKRILHDKEVEAINKAAGAADLPRAKAMNQKAFGFAEGGTVGPEEWMAEEHVNHKVLPTAEREANLAKFLKPSVDKRRMYHATKNKFNAFKPNFEGTFLTPNTKFANEFAINYAEDPVGEEGPHGLLGVQQPYIAPVHVQVKNPFDYQNPEHREILKKAAKKHHGTEKMTPWIDKLDRGHNFEHMEHSAILEPLKKAGFDSYYVSENGNKNLAVFDPRKIKSAIGNRGTYDTTKADITKAKGGSIKPVGYTKEKVTVSPSLDQMQYELISVKHSKKVK